MYPKIKLSTYVIYQSRIFLNFQIKHHFMTHFMLEIDTRYLLLFCYQTLKLTLILAAWSFRTTYPETISCSNVSLV